MTVHVLPVWVKNPYSCPEVSTVEHRSASTRELSPFILGPIDTWDIQVPQSKNFENLWQYSKVYSEFTNRDGNPSFVWYQWRNEGWLNPIAIRYPMGKGRKPEYSYMPLF